MRSLIQPLTVKLGKRERREIAQPAQDTLHLATWRPLRVDGNEPLRRDLAESLEATLLRRVYFPAGVGGIAALTQTAIQPLADGVIARSAFQAGELRALRRGEADSRATMLAPQEGRVKND